MPEAFCPVCGKETLMLKEPVYEGFTRVGERVKCAVCGHVFEAEAAPVAPVKKTPAIFTDADRSPVLAVFGDGENRVLCRYCAHYLVNPFKQFCTVHNKEVEATDTCPQFTERKPPAAGADVKL